MGSEMCIRDRSGKYRANSSPRLKAGAPLAHRVVAYGYRKRVTHETVARSRARTQAWVSELAGHRVRGFDPMVAAARAVACAGAVAGVPVGDAPASLRAAAPAGGPVTCPAQEEVVSRG